MSLYYSRERNVQILVSLLKAYGIKKVVASPGTCNVPFVASIQQDSYFEIYSVVDERSAAYIACGLSAESREPVALSCTGATSSRNYMPGLTEAFYRKLPILAITSSNPNSNIGHHIPQVTDRRFPAPDVAKLSICLPAVHCIEDEWNCEIQANRALSELRRRGGGPVHINLITSHSPDFSVKELPPVRIIQRVMAGDSMPELGNSSIGIFVGAHSRWSTQLTEIVDAFCENYDAVVLGDQTGNYKGQYGVLPNLVTEQEQYFCEWCKIDILIHIGEVSGAYINLYPEQVWRVSIDGEMRDTFKKLRYIFEMEEIDFFTLYNKQANERKGTSFYQKWKNTYDQILNKMPELPFSNGWIANRISSYLPENSVLHLGILNSLRMWNYFPIPQSVNVYCNTGGFGIDGGISTLLGASLANRNKIYFGVIGDLAFFYDMNALGNRHIGNNIRILLVNNGCGNEFHDHCSLATRAGLGHDIDDFIAAGGHFGNKSAELVRNYVENLGFEYLVAADKSEFLNVMEHFLQPSITERPMLLEVFIDSEEDSQAHEIIDNLEISVAGVAKKVVKEILGDKGIRSVKKIING